MLTADYTGVCAMPHAAGAHGQVAAAQFNQALGTEAGQLSLCSILLQLLHQPLHCLDLHRHDIVQAAPW